MITTGKGEPDGVLVVVRDSGPGLSSLDLERIFEAFYTTKSGGLQRANSGADAYRRYES